MLIGLWENLTCWVLVFWLVFSLLSASGGSLLTSALGLDSGSPSGPLETCRNTSAQPNSTSKNSRNVIYTKNVTHKVSKVEKGKSEKEQNNWHRLMSTSSSKQEVRFVGSSLSAVMISINLAVVRLLSSSFRPWKRRKKGFSSHIFKIKYLSLLIK